MCSSATRCGTPSTRTSSPRRLRYGAWWKPACSAGRAAAASSNTATPERNLRAGVPAKASAPGLESPTCSQQPFAASVVAMRIAVCVKHVPEGSARIDSASMRLDRSGEGALNHFDANAVEEALRLKGDSDGEVVVV